ncbi:NACHT domain-containing protein [Actinocorallia sp. B10E7]|uniref:NACHT N-terminal Helical domain 1-containing protein n=1 Tax=Actinocorallia sp. B10E7 TaxID=3153558 RepID=UPI00325DD00E
MPELFTTWITSPVWGELVSRMIPRAPAPGAGLAEPVGWRERLAWRRGDRKELVEQDLRSLVHQLALLATDEKPQWRFIAPEEGERAEDAVVTALLSLDAVDIDLALRADLDPGRLSELMREAAPDAADGLTDDRALALFTKLLDGACLHLVEHFTRLGEFGPRVAVETIRRVADLGRRLPDLDEKTRAYEARYRTAVAALYGKVRLYGLGLPFREQTYELATAYVNLSVRSGAPDRADGPEGLVPAREFDHRFEDLLAAHPRLLMEGPAGAGKTTLLQHLTLLVCKQSLPAQLDGWKELGVVPFLLRLRDHMSSDGLRLPSVEQFVEQDAAADDKPAAWVTGLLDAGRAVVFVDGLDEVPQEFRPQVMEWLERRLTRHPNARFVVTSRPGALSPFQREQLSAWGFVSSRLEPMNVGQVNDFIRRWHRTRRAEDGGETAEEQAEALIEALTARRDLSRLATNPLLCAMLCALGRLHNSVLPEGRTALYDQALTMLLEARDRERRIPSGELSLTRAQSEPFLSGIAMWMTLNGRRTIDHATALAKIERLLPRLRKIQTTPKAVLGFLRERSGLLQDPTTDSVEFRHPSLQDYLAAVEIFQEHNLDHLVRHADDPLYHDVLIMAVGQSQRDRTRQDRILRDLIARAEAAPSEDTAQTLWLLAAACVAEAEVVSEELARTITDRTERLIPPKNADDARRLAKAGPFVIDLVAEHARTHDLTEDEAAAIAETVLLTDVDASIPLLARLSRVAGGKVQEALSRGWFRSRFPEEYAREVLSGRQTVIKFPAPDSERSRLLRLLPGLRRLHLSGAGPADLSFVSDLVGLRTLLLLRARVSDVAPLTNLTRLEHLDLTGTQVNDLMPLANLTLLKQLNLTETRVSDLTPLTNLTRLEHLDLTGTQVNDLTPLTNLTCLKHLDLTGTQVNDLTPLTNLTCLRRLYLNRTESLDVSALAHLDALLIHQSSLLR